MSSTDWIETAISTQHNRKGFDCGEPELNSYLQRYARQNHASGGARCFVAAPRDEPGRVLGFYTLSPGEVAYARTPEVIRKSLGRYAVPVYRLGRLAVDRSMQGHGLGGRLLLAAGERAVLVAAQAGGVALLIDAKNERAANWYASFGAVPMDGAPLSLLLPLATIEKAVLALNLA